jgi:hypothetical protein
MMSSRVITATLILYLFIYLFVVYLMTLSVAQTICRKIVKCEECGSKCYSAFTWKDWSKTSESIYRLRFEPRTFGIYNRIDTSSTRCSAKILLDWGLWKVIPCPWVDRYKKKALHCFKTTNPVSWPSRGPWLSNLMPERSVLCGTLVTSHITCDTGATSCTAHGTVATSHTAHGTVATSHTAHSTVAARHTMSHVIMVGLYCNCSLPQPISPATGLYMPWTHSTFCDNYVLYLHLETCC